MEKSEKLLSLGVGMILGTDFVLTTSLVVGGLNRN